MPFTFAHPAAVIPLPRVLGKFAVPSALVIGSVTPDLAYLLPLGVTRTASHSIAGLFWFCLPVGLAAFVLFHLVVKIPLVSLMPRWISVRMSDLVPATPRLPSASWPSVGLSLLAGAATHIAWDAFTHKGAPAVQAIGALRAALLSVGGHQLLVYKALQHASTTLGMGFLAWWVVQWLRQTPPRPTDAPIALEPRLRAFSISMLCAVPILFGLSSGLRSLSRPLSLSAVQTSAGIATLSALSALGVALFAFGALWHLSAGRSSWTRRERNVMRR